MRHFIHVENQERTTHDDDGSEFPSHDAAIAQAAKMAGVILGEESGQAGDRLALRVLVDGPDGEPIATIRAELTRGGAGR